MNYEQLNLFKPTLDWNSCKHNGQGKTRERYLCVYSPDN